MPLRTARVNYMIDLKSLRSEIFPVVQRNEESPLSSQQELKHVKINGPRRLRLGFTPSSLSALPQQRIAIGNYLRTRRNACERGSMVIAWLGTRCRLGRLNPNDSMPETSDNPCSIFTERDSRWSRGDRIDVMSLTVFRRRYVAWLPLFKC